MGEYGITRLAARRDKSSEDKAATPAGVLHAISEETYRTTVYQYVTDCNTVLTPGMYCTKQTTLNIPDYDPLTSTAGYGNLIVISHQTVPENCRIYQHYCTFRRALIGNSPRYPALYIRMGSTIKDQMVWTTWRRYNFYLNDPMFKLDDVTGNLDLVTNFVNNLPSNILPPQNRSNSLSDSLQIMRNNLEWLFENVVWLRDNTVKERLTSNLSVYVRTDGNDNNDGLSNTPTGAFKTISKAVSTIASKYYLGVYSVYINVAAGVYSNTVSLPAFEATTGRICIQGESRDTTIIRRTNGGNLVTGVEVPKWNVYIFKNIGFEIDITAANTSSSCIGILANKRCEIYLINTKLTIINRDTTNVTVYGYYASGGLIRIQAGSASEAATGNNFEYRTEGSYTNNAIRVLYVVDGDIVIASNMVINADVTNSSNDTRVLTAMVMDFGRITIKTSYSPTLTGNIRAVRYRSATNSIIDVNGNQNFFPGILPGECVTGGVYV